MTLPSSLDMSLSVVDRRGVNQQEVKERILRALSTLPESHHVACGSFFIDNATKGPFQWERIYRICAECDRKLRPRQEKMIATGKHEKLGGGRCKVEYYSITETEGQHWDALGRLKEEALRAERRRLHDCVYQRQFLFTLPPSPSVMPNLFPGGTNGGGLFDWSQLPYAYDHNH